MPSYGAPIDETIVRIRSEHKWPQKVELDTTMPKVVPSSPVATGIAVFPYHATSREELIRKALRETRGNRTNAAKILEISHRALLYKIKEYEIDDL